MIRSIPTHSLVKRWYPSAMWQMNDLDKLYLTFDDGPSEEVTPWVLDQLAKYDAHATFFVVGMNAEFHPEIAQQIVGQGHSLGNHTYHHLKGWSTSVDDYIADIKKCDDLISNYQNTNLFRPPYGRITRRQQKALKNKRMVMWSHLSWDFDINMNAAKVLRKLKQAKGGSILLFHDTQKAFKQLELLLPELLSHYHALGYKFSAIK